MRNYLSIAMLALAVAGCSPQKPPESPAANTPEIAAAAATEITDEAGVRVIPITTPKGDFKVWTKKGRRQSPHQGPASTRRAGRNL
ncbi:hypothetical protein [Hyphomonas sp.]|jgi:proline iminopeptidase|uniref:hypothetical protein n=1 Tax=Hyphomonas sp. TaxID=87 RepID=UPI00356AB773